MDERFRILRAMNEVTGKVGLKEFAGMIDMSIGRTLGFLHGLVKTGFVRNIEGRYSITTEGKIALKALSPVPEGTEFRFYNGIGQFAGLEARSLKEFREVLREVDVKALEFHVSRGDFEKWIKTVFNDTALAGEIAKMRESKTAGESLRKEILGATNARYSKFERLLVS